MVTEFKNDMTGKSKKKRNLRETQMQSSRAIKKSSC